MQTVDFKTSRPIGLVMLCAFLCVVAGFGLISALPSLLTTQGVNVAFHAIAVSISGILLFNAWGLWQMQRWALFMLRLILALNIFIVMYNFFVTDVDFLVIFEGALYVSLFIYVLFDDTLDNACSH
jgi:chromate transport protein ChrA